MCVIGANKKMISSSKQLLTIKHEIGKKSLLISKIDLFNLAFIVGKKLSVNMIIKLIGNLQLKMIIN